MSETGKRLIESAQQALAFAKDQESPETCRVHIPGESVDLKDVLDQLPAARRTRIVARAEALVAKT